MGNMLDSLLGRSFKASKFKSLLNLSLSRLVVLRNRRLSRLAIARSDVLHILLLPNHDRALLRAEHVIMEQNMLDVFTMIEGYCVLLCERISLLQHSNKECPDELKEAVSSLIFAASRIGEFPELQKIRYIFTSRFGKEFTARAVELRNNCGVSPRMIQKLSTRQPSLENRMNVLKETASENGIVLQIEEAASVTSEEKLTERKENQPEHDQPANGDAATIGDYYNPRNFPEAIYNDGKFTTSIKMRRKFRDVADAAQEAFVSAAYAAVAARAAVELSHSSSHKRNDGNDHHNLRSKAFDSKDREKSEINTAKENDPVKVADEPIKSISLDSDCEEIQEIEEVESKKIKNSESVGFSTDSKSSEESEDNITFKKQIKSKVEILNTFSRSYPGYRMKSAKQLNTEKWPLSVRTRK